MHFFLQSLVDDTCRNDTAISNSHDHIKIIVEFNCAEAFQHFFHCFCHIDMGDSLLLKFGNSFQQSVTTEPLDQHTRNADTEILYGQEEVTTYSPFKNSAYHLVSKNHTKQCN